MKVGDVILSLRDIKRFKSKFQTGPNDECWIYTGATVRGYVQLRTTGTPPRMVRVHRISYTLYVGPIPEGVQVLHDCDVRNCVNPRHLFLGSHTDNMKDMVSKGRQNHGETHGRAKLTTKQVLAIRKRYKPGHPKNGKRALSIEFGVTPTHLRSIITNKYWRTL